VEEQPFPTPADGTRNSAQTTFDAIRSSFCARVSTQPLILIFEDLHWNHSETQGFLDTLSESVASARLLLLVNYRPEYRRNGASKTYYTQLRLAPPARPKPRNC